MLYKLDYIFECYNSLRAEYPWWLTMIFVVLHIIAVLFCVIMNNHDNNQEKISKSHNSLHCSFWLTMIIGFPFLGILLYFLFSFIPYQIWKKKSINADNFPFTCKIPKMSWALNTIAGGVGIITGIILKELYFDSESLFLCYAIPMSMWIITTIFDLNKNYLGKYLFISLADSDESDSDEIVPELSEEESIFGNSHFAEIDTKKDPEIFGIESLLARKAADTLVPDGIMSIKSSGDILNSTGMVSGCNEKGKIIYKSYKCHGNKKDFETSNSDVYEIKYIGRGVTRYIMAFWAKNDDDSLMCIDRVRYRVASPLKFVLMRSFIIFFIIWTLFSTNAADISCNIVTFINSIIGG